MPLLLRWDLSSVYQQIVFGFDIKPPFVLHDLQAGILELATEQVPGSFHCMRHHHALNLPVFSAAASGFSGVNKTIHLKA